VLRRHTRRIRIRVIEASGEVSVRSVTPEHVRQASDEYIQQHRAIYDTLGDQP
jgi:hypothetical protein